MNEDVRICPGVFEEGGAAAYEICETGGDAMRMAT